MSDAEKTSPGSPRIGIGDQDIFTGTVLADNLEHTPVAPSSDAEGTLEVRDEG